MVPGFQKNDFYDFSVICLRKNGPEIWESRVRRPRNLESETHHIESETHHIESERHHLNRGQLPELAQPAGPAREAGSDLSGAFLNLSGAFPDKPGQAVSLEFPRSSHSRFPDFRPIFS